MRTNIHDARGASRGKKTWAERRGPEPPAAVKDAFGAAFGRAATPAFGGRCATHACVSRFGRWSTIGFDGDAWPCRPAEADGPRPGPRRQARSLQSFAGNGEERSRGDNGVM